MSEATNKQIDRLLSDVADEGMTADRAQELERLLLNRPESQEHYARTIELLLLLEHEFDFTLRDPIPLVVRDGSDSDEKAIDGQAGQAARPPLTGPHGDSRKATRKPPSVSDTTRQASWLMLATAATLLIGWALLGPPRGPERSVALIPQSDTDSVSPLRVADIDQPLPIRDASALASLSQITRTALVTSLYLPQRAVGAAPRLTLCSGTAWMERGYGERERGYVFTLQPGQTMSLHVTTNAASHNSLALIELEGRYDPVGEAIKLNFSSLIDVNDPNPRRQTGRQHNGQVGNYVTTNSGAVAKHFLLVGSHAVRGREAESTWNQSDFHVAFDDSDLLVIGWDDSGYGNPKQPPPYAWEPDRDYDDLQATIRFTPAEAGLATNEPGGVRLRPEPLPDGPMVSRKPESHRLSVMPGEERVVIVSSSTSTPTKVRIVESETRHVLWELEGKPPAESDLLQSTVAGCYAIANTGPSVYNIDVEGSHVEVEEDGTDAWKNSPVRWRSVTDDSGSLFLSHLGSGSRGVTVQTRVFSR
ncbi:MAG: hypothetical protein AAF266_04700 [Planctomycetota bacterium]